METILALLGFGFLAALWSRVGQQRRELGEWKSALWGVQSAGANLEQRVMMLEAASRPVDPTWGQRPLATPAPAVACTPIAEAEPDVEPPVVAPPGPVDAPSTQEQPSIEPPAMVDEVDAPTAEPPIMEQPAFVPRPLAKPISLEQWLGVRGAAALGAAVLVLAGIFFFKYSIENDLLTTTMRVALGAAAGVAATAGSELWLRRRHVLLANCLTGAGLAIFYLTFWAAFARYELVSAPVAGALLVLVTASTCVLAIKRSSLAIAALGLVGGFATPMMLSTGNDRPFVLFGYLFLLDVGLLFVAYKRRWPGLALLSLVGTSGYQALWIAARMGPERLGFGMVLCGIFAVMFAFAGERRERDGADDLWRATRAAALAIPMGFAFYLSVATHMSAQFGHVAMLLVGLLAGAAVVARREGWPRLLKASLFPTLCTLCVWLLLRGLGDAWLVGGFCVAIAVMLQVVTEIDSDSTGDYADGVLGWVFGSFFVTISAVAYAQDGVTPWPWMISWLCLALIALRNGASSGREPVILGGATALSVGTLAVAAQTLPGASGSEAELFVAFTVGLVVLYQLATLLLSYPASRAMAGHASAVLPTLLLLMLPAASSMRPELHAVASLMLLALVAIATVRNAASLWLLVGTCVAGVAQWWQWQLADADVMSAPWDGSVTHVHAVSLFAHGATAIAVCVWPLVTHQRVRDAASTWRAAALAPVIMFLPMVALQRRMFGQTSTAVLALALGTLTLGTLIASRRRRARDESVQQSATAWLGGVSLGFATVAVPLALEHEWVTIGWALLATALIALWRRVDHAGLKYVAVALNAVVFVRLVLVFNVATYHAAVGMPVLNWITYTYLVPVACLVANVVLLRDLETSRLRKWEPVLADGRPIIPMLCGAAAIVLGFVWINLTVVDVFSVHAGLDLDLARMPARDLTMSISWAFYGLALLGAGMWRQAGALRKASLALILITCGKVFLFDLAHLRDLYRVVSLTGLALSLIVVSFAYHRFVFRSEEDAA